MSDKPLVRARAALTQLGLPYAQDAAVTRHLAAFLTRQAGATEAIAGLQGTQPAGAGFLHPSAVLFNGGVLKSGLLAERLLTVLNGWLRPLAPPRRACSAAPIWIWRWRGAAYFGYVRRGSGHCGGAAQSYYVGVESNMPAIPGMEPPLSALCLAPFGMEEGTEVALEAQEFGLVVGEPVRLRFLARRHGAMTRSAVCSNSLGGRKNWSSCRKSRSTAGPGPRTRRSRCRAPARQRHRYRHAGAARRAAGQRRTLESRV